MIEGGKHHDSLEELFTLQNTEESKLIVRYKLKKATKNFFKLLRDVINA